MNESLTGTYSYDHFDLRKWLTGINRNKFFILGCIIASVLMALLYLWLSTPLYSIQSTLVIMDEKKGEGMSVSLKELNFLDDQKIVENEAEILKSVSILSKVVVQLGLNTQYLRHKDPLKRLQVFYSSPIRLVIVKGTPDPYMEINILIADDNTYYLNDQNKQQHHFGDTITPEGSAYIIHKTDAFSQRTGNEYSVRMQPVNEVMQSLRNDIAISAAGKNSSVLNISLLHPSPRKGIEILRGIITEYNLVNRHEKQVQTDTILAVIEKRLSLISGQLNIVESSEENYKVKRGITQLSDDSRMFLDKAKSNDQELAETAARLTLLEDLEKYIVHPGSGLAPPNIGEHDESLVNNVNELNRLELERSMLESTTGKENPMLQIKLDQINNIRSNILNNVLLRKNDLINRLSILKNNKANIDTDILSVPVNERRLLELMREKNIRENIYTYLLQKREEASIKDVSVFQKMRVIDPPYSSAYTVQPKKKIILAGAVFIGFLFPVFVMGIKRQLNNKVHSSRLIEELSGVKVAGEVSGTFRSARPLFRYDNNNIPAEQFRRIRGQLSRQLPDPDKSVVFLVTSAVKGEGKSFVAIQLAICFSLLGRKTLLIDGDLRHPKLHTLLNMPDSPQLMDELRSDSPGVPKKIMSHPQYPQLDVVRGSAIGEENSGLWEGDLSGFFNGLKERYQYIFVNSPPFRMFADAEQIEKYTDATLFVVRYNYSTFHDLDCIRQTQHLFKNPSVIFNNVPLSQLYDKKMIRGKYFRY